jgi:hypothetical protein
VCQAYGFTRVCASPAWADRTIVDASTVRFEEFRELFSLPVV